jgi:methyltransferase (TIGR00027 family)
MIRVDPVTFTLMVGDISDTARWMALYRARESERADALFHDPYALRLAGPEGEALVRRLETEMQGDWPVIVRTAVMDEIILRLVASGVRRVLNLAAGLDARPWRLPLAPDVRWIDADLPGVLDHKLGVLAGEPLRCYYRPARVDLADVRQRQELLEPLGDGAGQTLVITEGLLGYLDPDAVATLAGELHSMRGCRWWLTDLASPDLLEIAVAQASQGHASSHGPVLRFAPDAAPAWFARLGWSESEFHSTVHEGIRLERTPDLDEFWEQLPPARTPSRMERIWRFAGIVLLEAFR